MFVPQDTRLSDVQVVALVNDRDDEVHQEHEHEELLHEPDRIDHVDHEHGPVVLPVHRLVPELIVEDFKVADGISVHLDVKHQVRQPLVVVRVTQLGSRYLYHQREQYYPDEKEEYEVADGDEGVEDQLAELAELLMTTTINQQVETAREHDQNVDEGEVDSIVEQQIVLVRNQLTWMANPEAKINDVKDAREIDDVAIEDGPVYLMTHRVPLEYFHDKVDQPNQKSYYAQEYSQRLSWNVYLPNEYHQESSA